MEHLDRRLWDKHESIRNTKIKKYWKGERGEKCERKYPKGNGIISLWGVFQCLSEGRVKAVGVVFSTDCIYNGLLSMEFPSSN